MKKHYFGKNRKTLEEYEKRIERKKQKDLAEKAVSEENRAELEKTIEEKVSFKAKHGFEEIPAEIQQIREANPNLTWEQAYRVADYHEVSNANPNP